MKLPCGSNRGHLFHLQILKTSVPACKGKSPVNQIITLSLLEREKIVDAVEIKKKEVYVYRRVRNLRGWMGRRKNGRYKGEQEGREPERKQESTVRKDERNSETQRLVQNVILKLEKINVVLR